MLLTVDVRNTNIVLGVFTGSGDHAEKTVEAMQSGAVLGFAGLVDGIVTHIRLEVPGFAGADVVVVATGDSAPLIMTESATIERHEPDLTLEGLRLVVYERNQARKR